MSLELKSKTTHASWTPTASLSNLKMRAHVLARIREFFAKRQVLEVETPLLDLATNPDPTIQSLAVTIKNQTHYLQTSPEFCMKRLLASGSGAIYQICKAFRDDECGRYHQYEFTMMEWYQLNYSLEDLMNEADALLQFVAQTQPAEKISYQQLFENHFAINPHEVDCEILKNIAAQYNLTVVGLADEKDDWLNLLMSFLIEPTLGKTKPILLYDFPVSQAALAKIEDNRAKRVEIYFKGLELANGFLELTDAAEQRQRFVTQLQQRRERNLPIPALDENFLAALEYGLPECAGMALGIDRLLMAMLDAGRIDEVVTFGYRNQITR